jgi:hypothetical protein
VSPGDLVWIDDECLPDAYRFIGLALEIPKDRDDDYEHLCYKVLSDGDIYYVEPEMVSRYEEV